MHSLQRKNPSYWKNHRSGSEVSQNHTLAGTDGGGTEVSVGLPGEVLEPMELDAGGWKDGKVVC